MNERTAAAMFTYTALDLVRGRLEASETATDFLAEVDALANDPKNTLPLAASIEFHGSLDHADDGTNAPAVLEAVGLMDRANAADPRLWSYLGLVTQRDYMQRRWPIDKGQNWKGRVEDRWLMTRPTRQSMVRHGIGRLWWMAELTHDPSMSRPTSRQTGDPYAYTRWLFANEDRVQAIFEREIGSSSGVMWAVIEAMQGSTASNQGQAIKDLAKEVVLSTGYRRLETLDDEELRSLVQEMQNPPAPMTA